MSYKHRIPRNEAPPKKTKIREIDFPIDLKDLSLIVGTFAPFDPAVQSVFSIYKKFLLI